jgi:hypothetical protein
MIPFRLPRLPDRKMVHHYISVLQPRAGRIIGALSGMMLAGPAWLYGLCVGLLLGYMVDTVRTKSAAGSTGSIGSIGSAGSAEDGKKSPSGESRGEPFADSDAPEDETSHASACTAEEAAEPYHLLGLLPGASPAEVKKAWRTQSRQAHPDAPGGAAEDFMALKSAYEKILEQRKE